MSIFLLKNKKNHFYYLVFILPFLLNSCYSIFDDNDIVLLKTPNIQTTNSLNISIFTATIHAELVDDGDSPIKERGICWNTQKDPTISDSKLVDSNNSSFYAIKLDNLQPLTTYYARAYAINKKGIGYSKTISFTTLGTSSSIATSASDSIDITSAILGGTVASISDFSITDKGVCWSTNPNPTINDFKSSNGEGSGSFISNLTGLTSGTRYYVRAYATNESKVIYGNEVSFKTLSVLSLQPSAEGKDAYINSRVPDATSGSGVDIDIMAWTYSGAKFLTRSLLDFDLSIIPQGSMIKSATLSLYNNPTSQNNSGKHSDANTYPSTGGDNAVLVKRITQYWDENTVTWNTQPTTTDENQAIIQPSTDVHQDYPSIDITSVIQSIINNKTSSYGMMLILQTEEYYRGLIFASSDYPDSSKHPKLVVVYY